MKLKLSALIVMQYLLHGRESALLLLLQNLNLLEQTASFQTQPSNFLKYLFILCLKQSKQTKMNVCTPRFKLLTTNNHEMNKNIADDGCIPGMVAVCLTADGRERETLV